jgi:hypothetical protein
VVEDVTAAETKAKARQFATAPTAHRVEIGRGPASDQYKPTTLVKFSILISFSILPDAIAAGDTARASLGMHKENLVLKASPPEGRACSAAEPGA